MIRVLIPDGESYFADPVIHCLARHSDVRLHIGSTQRWTPQRFSRHSAGFHALPIPEDQRVSAIVELIDRHRIDVLLPVSEDGQLFVARHSDALRAQTRLAGHTDSASLERAIDKAALSELAQDIAIPVPLSRRLNRECALDDLCAGLEFPILLKATRAGGGRHIHRLESLPALAAFLGSHPEIGSDYVVQQFHRGTDVSCNVLCQDGELVAWAIYEGRSPGLRPFAPALAVQFLEDPSTLEKVRTLMRALRWNGVADVGWIRDAASGETLLLEINARFWSSLLAARAAGVDFPYLACQSALGVELEAPHARPIFHQMLSGSWTHVTRSMLRSRPAPILIRDLTDRLADPLPIAVRRLQSWWARRPQG